jgi:hypothetical protein
MKWKKKLIALCEGLELENIDKLIKHGAVGDYMFLGSLMAKIIKKIQKERDECRGSYNYKGK